MINITDEYLEDEIRDGFYIPSMTKRAFAMELTVLDLIDSICRKHNITYFADWGTYLGAVRHGGFVPWDDDLDICMHRNEFEKFCVAAKSDFPEGYEIITFKNNDYSWKFIANVAPNNRMCFEPSYLKTHYAFPYIVGIDIFLIDNINDDFKLENESYEVIKKALNVSNLIDTFELTEDELHASVKQLNNTKVNNTIAYISRELGIKIDDSLLSEISPIEIKRILYREVENILKSNNQEKTKNVVQKVPWGVYHGLSFPRDYFEESVRIPFEITTIPVPICYDRGMRIKYGAYMKIIMGAGGHDYPYFLGQKRELKEDLDYPVLYKFNEQDIEPAVRDFSGSLKTIASDMLEYFSESISVITGIFESINNGTCEYTANDISGFLADVQDNVIQFGTLIEKVKGEGTNIVSLLEKYCELLFVLSNDLDGNNNVLADLISQTNKIASAIKDEIMTRRTVLFLPFKAKYWSSLEPVFKMECQKENTDVYVVTLPYFYKEYNGAFKETEHNESADIIDMISKCPMAISDATNVYVRDYNDIDLSLFCPDAIYIQNPYDEFNMALSVPQYFYARNIRQYTNKLIYVPFFKLMEFEKTNVPCFYNMQYYCTVPGVVLSDEIWTQSENTMNRYIDKIEEWCDEGLSSHFYNKFKIITDIIPDYFVKEPVVPEVIKPFVDEAKNDNKKILVWYVNAGTLFEYKEEFLDKMKRCLNTFIDSKDNISVFLVYDEIIYTEVAAKRPDLYSQITDFTKAFKAESVGIVVNDYASLKELNNIPEYTDAYYGNPSVICKDFELAKKPIMLQTVEI